MASSANQYDCQARVAGFDTHRLFDVVAVEFFLQVGFETRSVCPLHPERVAGQQRLAENDKFAALRRGRALHADLRGDRSDTWVQADLFGS